MPASRISAWAAPEQRHGAAWPSRCHLRGSCWDAYVVVEEILVPESRGES